MGRYKKRTDVQCAESSSNTHGTKDIECREVLSTEANTIEGLPAVSAVADILLLTGVARLKHANSNEFEKVQILLDTGADRSFIQNELAE